MVQQSRLRRHVGLAVICLVVATCAPAVDRDAVHGTVRVGVVAPNEAGPRGQVLGVGYLTGTLVGETLVSISETGEVLPRLVERWERSADGRTWRFFLKKGVRFHNGETLRTDLILSALKRQLPGLIGARDVTRVDDTAFEIVQDEPSTLLLDGLIDVGISTGEANRAGTGPFIANETGGAAIEFRAFDAYHRGTPSIDAVGLQRYTNQRTAWAALMRRDIDVLYEVSPEARGFIQTESTVSVSAFVRPYTSLLGFNIKHPTFQDKRIRRALNLAVDRDEIVKTALLGHGTPAYDHLWPKHWAVDASRARYPSDRLGALKLLEASGRTMLTSRSAEAMPSRLAFHCLVYEPLEKFALAIQRQLALIDVDMTVELLSAPAMGQRIGSGRFEAFLFELTNVRTLGYTYFFWHSESPGSVRTGYDSADEALDAMRLARNDEEIKAAVRVVQDVMRDDPPAIFIAYPEMARAVSRRFEIPAGPEDIFHSISRWKLAPGALQQ